MHVIVNDMVDLFAIAFSLQYLKLETFRDFLRPKRVIAKNYLFKVIRREKSRLF